MTRTPPQLCRPPTRPARSCALGSAESVRLLRRARVPPCLSRQRA
ncbi:formin-like protein 5 [Iris pallida]|uniref:Formin-like protein 5 n=1 Tax=Iris pallida TaxID=29817 RepID=A0AAX6G988_IRIPA|nr:formin-like protein 5 [Iris pallida]